MCDNQTHKDGWVEIHSLYGCGGVGDYHHHHHSTVDEVLCL